MALVLKTAPATEPVTTAEAKIHLRVTISTDDSLINDLIAAARRYAETLTRRAFITQTWNLYADAFPANGIIEMPRPPLVSVTSVKYTDVDGVEQTVAAGDYAVDAKSEPGRIIPAYGESWPSTREVNNAVNVEFVAGYGAASAVPEEIKAAVLLLIGHWYENREDVVVGTITKPLDRAARSLLRSVMVPIIV